MSTTTLDDTALDRGWPDGDTGPGPDRHDGADVQPAEAPARPRPSRARSRRPGGVELDRATVRRVLERHAAVGALPRPDLELMAGLLGVETDAESVTVSSLVGGKAGTATALQDLRDLADAGSDMDALLEAIELGPERVRALNALVAAVTGGTPVRLHASHAKAARQVVVAVRGLDAKVRSRIAGLAPLLR